MEAKNKTTVPRYQQIAVDIANNIAKNKYQVGEKISGRSVLASKYGVSPETIRKAISILSDYKIVETRKNSGIIIMSAEKAQLFIRNSHNIESVNDLRKEIVASAKKQKHEIAYLNELISKLVDKIEHFYPLNPFIPFEVEIGPTSHCINKSIDRCKFWQHTSATVIGLKRNNELIKSPGPNAVLLENDLIYFIGDDDCYQRVIAFINAKY